MTYSTEATVDQMQAASMQQDMAPGLVKRSLVFGYGFLAYNIGVIGLVWLILAMGGLAPVGFSPLQSNSIGMAILINTALIVLFGLQHSVMARQGFKQRLQQLLPAAAERSTYVLLSGIFTVLIIAFWQPIDGNLWSVENPIAQALLWSGYAIGWSYLFIATFVTNHFELMGLRQVYLYLTNKPYTTLPFTRKYMYRYSRHPMMLGLLIGMWSLPVMNISHFIMSSLMTLYVIIGVSLEERDLVRMFGETYREYKKQIATIIPKIF